MDDGGLYTLPSGSTDWELITYDPDEPDGISSNVIWNMLEDEKGALWMATDNGLNRLSADRQSFAVYNNDPLSPYSIGSNFIISVFQDREDRLWIGSSEAGLSIIDEGIQRFHHYFGQKGNTRSLSNNAVWGFEQGQDGKIWNFIP